MRSHGTRYKHEIRKKAILAIMFWWFSGDEI